MKSTCTALATFIAALSLTACDSNKSSREKMASGTDKISEGVKEVASAAAESSKKGLAEAKEALERGTENAKDAAAEAKAKLDAAAAAHRKNDP